ncbi:MAG: pseudouridine synthase [Bradymonadia bacterium]
MVSKTKLIRLDRFLSNCGHGSRSQVTTLIKRGYVTIDGFVSRSGSTRISSTSTICIDGIEVTESPPVMLWHKPVGIQCTQGDPLGRPSLLEVIPPDILTRFHPVGRLDADTSGLLLFSRIGALTQRLLHPKHQLSRRYIATCENAFSNEHVSALTTGVSTSLGTFSAKVASFDNNRIELSVTEGKYRMVRRMLANVGQPVLTLQRIEYGPFALANLPLEEFRSPTNDEFEAAIALGLPGFDQPMGSA